MYARISSFRFSDRFFYALRREMEGRYGNVRTQALATAGSIRLRKKINPVASGKWEMSGGAVVAANPPLASTPWQWQQDPPAIRLATETVPPVLTLQRRPPEPQADI